MSDNLAVVTKLLLALHVVFAIFTVGPLVHAATTAGRGIRKNDAAAIASSARLLRIYGIASVLVVGIGVALMYRSFAGSGWYAYSDLDRPRRYVDYLPTDGGLGSFSQVWIWLSLVLWALSIALIFALIVPTLRRATSAIESGESAGVLTGRVAAGGGIVALSYLVIIVLMVYRPGS